VNDDAQERVAHNENVFRELNERIEAGHWPGDEANGVAFRCECGDLGCNLLLELTPADYERVRAHPRRFVVAPGHEKLDAAGRTAESLDPRD
jgi:hypothetical protein